MPYLKMFSYEAGAVRQAENSAVFPIQCHAGIWILKQFFIYRQALCVKQETQHDL